MTPSLHWTAMTDAELIAELHALGIDEASWRAVALLPLVQVAWADGRIQATEQELILRVADTLGLLEGRGGALLEGWLQRAPTAEQTERGRCLLVALTHRHRGIGADLDKDTLQTIQRLCEDVAGAAGGLFDTFFTVDDEERAVLDEINAGMKEQTEVLLDDLPSPDGGSFEDL